MQRLAIAAFGAALGICIFTGEVMAAACNGRVGTYTGPNGMPLQLCLDGKYTTCVRDRQRMGYSKTEAIENCDSKRARGLVK
jgi:hypothetical protein